MNQNKQNIISLFKDWITDPDAVILDTETTGLGDDAEIVEISAVDMRGYPIIDQLVKPKKAVPAEAIAIHGISNEMLADMPNWSQVYPEIAHALKGRTVIIYNAQYDVRLIEQTCELYDLPVIKADWQCAMFPFAEFYGEWNEPRGDFKWQSLVNAAKIMGVNVHNAHRALADCAMTLGVIKGVALFEGNVRYGSQGRCKLDHCDLNAPCPDCGPTLI